jgi:predicted GNAT family acetyltransferase
MNIRTYIDPAEFLERAQPYLEQREAINALILGITIRLRDRPEWTETPPYLAIVEEKDGSPVLVAAITPPFNLLAAGEASVHQEAVDLLVDNLQAGGWGYPGVNAEASLAARIAEARTRKQGGAADVRMRLRLYELRAVIQPDAPPAGSLRLATLADLDRVAAWRDAFQIESLHEAPSPESRRHAARQLEAGNTYLWEDGEPVSMAISTRPTPHGMSIGGVYTPPELRGRGYASACVAALSQHILDGGKQYTALFTDLDYPTSNSIYQKIGYRPICDFLEYQFTTG